jgi:hypothetical protein
VEGVTINFPTVSTTLEAMVSGWLILAVWATGGVALAMLTRGTSLAIGIGILWGLALEGLLAAFIIRIDALEWVTDIMIRANGYSLVRAVNGSDILSTDGPGAFAGPYVSGMQATAVLVLYLVAFTGLSAWLLSRRDIA